MSSSSFGICATVTCLANEQQNASVDISCMTSASHMERNGTKRQLFIKDYLILSLFYTLCFADLSILHWYGHELWSSFKVTAVLCSVWKKVHMNLYLFSLRCKRHGMWESLEYFGCLFIPNQLLDWYNTVFYNNASHQHKQHQSEPFWRNCQMMWLSLYLSEEELNLWELLRFSTLPSQGSSST